MPPSEQTTICFICSSPATVRREMMYSYADCPRCGQYQVERIAIDDVPLPLADRRIAALASYAVGRRQNRKQLILSKQFFDDLSKHTLPTPVELIDNLLLYIAERGEYRPGVAVNVDYRHPPIQTRIGGVDEQDVLWALRENVERGWLKGTWGTGIQGGHITGAGWQRVEELQLARVSSQYAFFARKFENTDLDRAYAACFLPAVRQTGYDLRTATQKAGHIDAIIEDEIRRCRFLIADLSDHNAGAYWEAGLAEGLRKPVIYICQEGVRTHFDTNHRQTVFWDLDDLNEAAVRLKAVIRNTLLGDAKQDD